MALTGIVGMNIKHYRTQKAISKEELAKRCDINVAYLERIEDGSVRLCVDVLEKIMKELNLTVEKLVTPYYFTKE